MTKFKFRVWDYDSKKMKICSDVHDSLVFLEKDGSATYYNSQCGECSGSMFSEPMMSSRLYDKNGQEIFDQDIVKVKGQYFKIQFALGSFMLIKNQNEVNMHDIFKDSWNDDYYPLCQLAWHSDSKSQQLDDVEIISNTYKGSWVPEEGDECWIFSADGNCHKIIYEQKFERLIPDLIFSSEEIAMKHKDEAVFSTQILVNLATKCVGKFN